MTESASDIFERCKLVQPAVEQFIQSQGKFHLALTYLTSSLSSVISSLQDLEKIMENKYGKNSHKADVIGRLFAHYTKILSSVNSLESSLAINVLTKFHKENENFKKTLSTKEKSSLKKFKKIKSNIKKSKSEITKLRKKVKDKSSSMPCIVSEERKSSNVLEQQLEKTTRQLYADYKDLGDQEDAIFKEIQKEEIFYFENMFNAFKSILLVEQKLHKSSETVQEILEKLDNNEAPSSIKSDEVTMEEENNFEADDEPEIAIEQSEELIEKELEKEELQHSFKEPVMNSRAGSYLSLSSFASYTFREERETKAKNENQQMYTTVKRCSSPFGSSFRDNDGSRRREFRRRFEPSSSRAPRPPLPPAPPQRSQSLNVTESLTNLRQKLDEITGVSDVNLSINETNNLSVSTCEIPATTSYRAPLIPRSAYMEDNTMKFLHEKLMSLSSMLPPASPIDSDTFDSDLQINSGHHQ